MLRLQLSPIVAMLAGTKWEHAIGGAEPEAAEKGAGARHECSQKGFEAGGNTQSALPRGPCLILTREVLIGFAACMLD